ncbi:MAG: hypothetical protein U0Y68_17945 [Blastocatellia bacterium]
MTKPGSKALAEARERFRLLAQMEPQAALDPTRVGEQEQMKLRSVPLLRWCLRLIALVSLIVPRQFRYDWRHEWEAELQHHESLLTKWRRMDWYDRWDLLRRAGSLRDALYLTKRLEEDMIQDLRYGSRMLRKHKGFTMVAIISLALGIGANTALFSVVDAVMLRMLPVPEPEQLYGEL